MGKKQVAIEKIVEPTARIAKKQVAIAKFKGKEEEVAQQQSNLKGLQDLIKLTV